MLLFNIYVTLQPRPMEIKFREGVAGPDTNFKSGGVYDLPVPEAKYWIGINLADEWEEPKQEKVIVQKVEKTSKRPINVS